MGILTGWWNNLFRKKPADCLACGDCCRVFSWHLRASDRDLERWRQLGRDDLLAHVDRFGGLWIDPQTRERLPLCPFLIETAPNKAHCGIHEIKPEICRAYPTLEHNRTCFKGTFLN